VRIVLGIGNPGSRYTHTRHNVGFMFLDFIAEIKSLNFKPGRGDYFFTEADFEGNPMLLVKPTTYVNNSGVAALQVLRENNLSPEELIVVCDDVNLETARLRVRAAGSNGGHNGISSIISHLFSDIFPRLRIGIGSDFSKGELSDYVLSDFSVNDLKLLKKTFKEAELLIGAYADGGVKKLLDANSKLSNK